MFKDTFEQTETKETKTHRKLDSILIYDKVFNYPNAPHIQQLDSYKTDFVFVKDFPKVLEYMSKILDRAEFKEMLRCAIRSNYKLSNDGKLLNPKADRILKNQWHGFLFKDFLKDDADRYIIRAGYYGKKNPLRKIYNIKLALDRNNELCTKTLCDITSDIDYRLSKERTFMQWLLDYSRAAAFSKNSG